MNKLKKLIKETYNEMPEHKFSFIEQLKSNPAWKKLHPFANISVISPSVPIISTVAVIGASTVLIAHNLNHTEPEPPVVPDILPITTVTAAAVRTAETVTSTAVTEQVFYITSSSAAAITTHSAAASIPVTTENPYIPQTIQTAPPETTAIPENTTVPETTTACFNTHLLRHDYTIAELAEAGDTLLYGYPDTDIARRLFSGFGDDYIGSSIAFTQPPVIEGEIISIEYTSRDGLPVTVWNVLVSEVFDFREVINIGDTVQIATYGGYMGVGEYISLNPDTTLFMEWSDEQINSTVIYEDGGNEVQANAGESYLFVLNDKEDFGGDSMYTMLSYSDIFRFYRSGGEYFCCNSAQNSSITYERLKEITDDRYYFTDGDRTLMIKDNAVLLSGIQDYYSVDKNGRIAYLGTTYTDDGFFPFRSEDDYTILWTDTGIEITYRFDSLNDIFKTITLDYPK